MILAVFSDIHSNHTALEACMREAEKRQASLWIFLGDYVSDCAYPRETMKLLYRAKKEHACVFIKGNREEYVLSHHKNGSDWHYGATTGSLLYTYENLTAQDLDFFDALPIVKEINPNGKCPICVCHGSPLKTREALYPLSYTLEKWLLRVEQPLLLGGHSHRPITARGYGKMYVNPGAVGVQVSGVAKAEMAFLYSDENRWVSELVRVPYNIRQTAEEIRTSGLLDCSGVWGNAILKQLFEAKNYSLFCVERAAELANGSEVQREHWIQAARDLGVADGRDNCDENDYCDTQRA